MTSRIAAAALAGLMAIASVAPAAAQTTPDFVAFSEACLGAQLFLLGELPPDLDPATILTPLCSCVVTEFAAFTQPEVDMLAADLRGESTEESHAAYPEYTALEDRARVGLTACFATPEVLASMPVPAE